jgi:hypothetical protein
MLHQLDLNKVKKPKFMAVITSSGFSFTRDDGILVIPLTMLKD